MQTCMDFHFVNLLLYVTIIQVTNSTGFLPNENQKRVMRKREAQQRDDEKRETEKDENRRAIRNERMETTKKK